MIVCCLCCQKHTAEVLINNYNIIIIYNNIIINYYVGRKTFHNTLIHSIHMQNESPQNFPECWRRSANTRHPAFFQHNPFAPTDLILSETVCGILAVFCLICNAGMIIPVYFGEVTHWMQSLYIFKRRQKFLSFFCFCFTFTLFVCFCHLVDGYILQLLSIYRII